MKTFTVLCILILLTGLTNITSGQEAYKLTDDSNRWYEYGEYGGYFYYPSQHVHLNYFFKGDTIIQNKKYKKLFGDRRDTTYTTPLYFQNSYKYYSAFRQDSLKVYFILADSSTENLYCDFNISVGDTLKYFYNKTNIKVKSISSIPFGAGYRKRYILENDHSFYEGIGSSLGLFHDWGIGIEGGVYLICFEQSGISQFVSDWPHQKNVVRQ